MIDPATALPPIATLDELRELVDLDRVVWCDVRWYLDGRDARAAYDGGHLPGAVFVDMDTVLAAPPTPEQGRHPLPSPTRFATELGALGVADDDLVVAYDDNGGLQAGRMVWMLRAIGRRAVVLDGGIQSWPGELTTDVPERAAVERTAVDWPAELLIDIDEVAARSEAGDTVILDARAAARYRGEMEPVDPKAGHIPGAKVRPVTDNVVDGAFKSAEQLRADFGALGVDESTPVIAYCGSGVTACHNILAIERAGLGTARLFPGSWSQWSNDDVRPVATGDD